MFDCASKSSVDWVQLMCVSVLPSPVSLAYRLAGVVGGVVSLGLGGGVASAMGSLNGPTLLLKSTARAVRL
jgi:hypothetical protein